MKPYHKNPVSAKNEELMFENKYYKRYLIKKEKIKSKYPPSLWENPLSRTKYDKEMKEMWLTYLKEISDLMYKKDGWFQKFVWDSFSDSVKDKMEQKARGLKKGERIDQTNY